MTARLISTADEALEVAGDYARSIQPGAVERDRSGKVPREELAALGETGLLGITVPGSYGGPGLPPVVLAEVIRTIAAVDPAIAQIPQGHFLVVDALDLVGTHEQRRRIYPEVLAGARIAAALAERGGQHAQALGTRLRRSGGDSGAPLTLVGRKYYSTGALTAQWIAVSALDEERRLSLALVPTTSDGLVFDEDWDAMGQRATVSGTTILDAVAVDPALVVPYQRAFDAPQQLGARAQLVHTAIQVGIAGGALRDARGFVQDEARPFFEAVRAGWAERAGDDPHVIVEYGRMATKVAAAEQLLRRAAETLTDVGLRPAGAEAAARGSLAVAQAKAFASEVAVEVSSDLFSLSGAGATAERHGLSRHWRNARTHASHDPVSWKYYHVGNYALNGALPPSHGQL